MLNLYLGISVIAIVLLTIFSIKSFQVKNSAGYCIGGVCTFCVVIILAYCCSALTHEYFWASFFSSIYYSSMTWMVLCLTCFTMLYTKIWSHKTRFKVEMVMAGITICDTAVMMINPFWEITAHFVLNGRSYAMYTLEKLPLYDCHLIWNYIMVLIVTILMVYRMVSVPREYKMGYAYILLVVLGIVVVNAAYLFLPEDNPLTYMDFSLLTYGVAGIVVYWNGFHYKERILANHFKSAIFDSIDEGIVVFDYDNELLTANSIVRKMMPMISFHSNLTRDLFAQKCGLSEIESAGEDSYSVQCYLEQARGTTTLRCYYSVLKNAQNRCTGFLYIFDDIAQETDILTGFHDWNSFTLHDANGDVHYDKGTPVAVVDINGLSITNQMYGMGEGDKKIRSLSVQIREVFPKNCYFVRGNEAHLVIICHGMDEESVLTCLNKIKENYEGSIQFAVSRIRRDSEGGVTESIRDAENGMQARKLLDKESIHSEMLTSLVRALEESDEDTEAHVKRTQKMGAMLGTRLGLSDVEQGNLALLCILHDIGKIGVPLEVLNKPGKLTDAEWKTIQSHVEKGYQIAKSSKDLEGIALMIRHHHERWDGKGYPDGLSEETIPILSRIISVVDAYDAMVNDRSYRKALSIEQARGELIRGAGNQFDPNIVAEYLALLKELDQNPEYAGVPGVGKYNPDAHMAELTGSANTAMEAGKASGQASLPKTTSITREQEEQIHHVHRVTYSKYILDENNCIVEADQNFEELTGYTPKEAIELRINQTDLLPEEDRTNYMLLVSADLGKSQRAFCEHRLVRKDGSNIYVLCYGRQYYDSTQRAARAEIIITTITSTYSANVLRLNARTAADESKKAWENMAHRDSLTGLLNRSAFESSVTLEMLHRTYKILFLMMDLDNFKNFNDTYGHKAGDDYLVLMARAMQEAVRNQDLLCRMGGDEFAAVLLLPKDFPDENIHRRIQRIFNKISSVLTTAEGGGGLSMGAFLATAEMETFMDIYQKADEALYEAKNAGRNRYIIGNRDLASDDENVQNMQEGN